MRRCLAVLCVLLAMATLGGCKGRDLSTPATRLVGHWHEDVALIDLVVDAYFGPLSEDGVGTLTITSDDPNMSGTGTYRVVSEDAEGEQITGTFSFGGDEAEVTLTVPRDGQTIKVRIPAPQNLAQAVGAEMTLKLEYVDGKTAP